MKETSLDHILEFWGANFKTTFNIWWLQLLVLWFSLLESVQYTNRSQVPRNSKISITSCVILSSCKILQANNADDEHILLFKQFSKPVIHCNKMTTKINLQNFSTTLQLKLISAYLEPYIKYFESMDKLLSGIILQFITW